MSAVDRAVAEDGLRDSLHNSSTEDDSTVAVEDQNEDQNFDSQGFDLDALTGGASYAAPSPMQIKIQPLAEALDQWRRLASDHKEAAVLGRLGNLAKQLGFLEEAESAFREAIEIDDKESRAYVGLASVLMERDEHEGDGGKVERSRRLRGNDFFRPRVFKVLARSLSALVPSCSPLPGDLSSGLS